MSYAIFVVSRSRAARRPYGRVVRYPLINDDMTAPILFATMEEAKAHEDSLTPGDYEEEGGAILYPKRYEIEDVGARDLANEYPDYFYPPRAAL